MSRLIPAVAIAALLAGSAAIAQTTTPGAPTPSPTPSEPSVTAPATTPTTPTPTPGATMGDERTMTDAEAQTWVDKAVYSSDDSNVGTVAAIERDASGKVTALQADVGGFLGIGSSRVKITPAQFNLRDDRVVLDLTAEQVKQLPKAD